MDKKFLSALIDVLQKQSNAIQELRTLNSALALALREHLILSGLRPQVVSKQMQKNLRVAEKAFPSHDWEQGVRDEVQQMVESLRKLENELKKKPN